MDYLYRHGLVQDDLHEIGVDDARHFSPSKHDGKHYHILCSCACCRCIQQEYPEVVFILNTNFENIVQIIIWSILFPYFTFFCNHALLSNRSF
jgi:hypothetical protein